MQFSSVPPVAASLITTIENILHIAPASRRWKADAPDNVVFLPATLTKQALLIQIGLLRPTTLIVADQIIDADVIEQWRISHPFGDLSLVRRGTSLDKVRLDLCESNGIRVVNTPGVNAPHVAAYIAHWLTLADGSIPQDIRVLGYGHVGKELVKLLLERDPTVRIKVLCRTPDTLGQGVCDHRVSFVLDGSEALQGACAVAICLSLNDESAHRIDRALIQCMHPHARLVCVAKPDVFSDDALHTLAAAEDIQLIQDYGPATLEAFRLRALALGCGVSTWRKPATLTIQAASTEACNCDLDYAVCVQLSLTALRGLVRRKLAQSLKIPSQPACAGAPRVSIIGRGINGLLQAVMLRLAGYQVAVYRESLEVAAALYDDEPPPANQYLAVECNRAGTELFERLLSDNPSLASVVRVSRDDASGLTAEMEALLQRAGVEFPPQRLSPSQISVLSRDHCVVTVMEGGDGVSVVHCSAHYQVVAPGTYAAGTTQGLLWASLVQEIIQAH